MQMDRYDLDFDSKKEKFEFVSKGTNGSFQKIILFQSVHAQMPFYNLAFGDKDINTGDLDDKVVTNNGDTDKVLATVVQSLHYFFEEHLYAVVFAQGSTKARTRLYQIGINKYLSTAQKAFIIFGKAGDDWEPFEKGSVYESFFVRKNI